MNQYKYELFKRWRESFKLARGLFIMAGYSCVLGMIWGDTATWGRTGITFVLLAIFAQVFVNSCKRLMKKYKPADDGTVR